MIKILLPVLNQHTLSMAEREVYKAAYAVTSCNQTKAAKLLGVARGTFITKMKEYKL